MSDKLTDFLVDMASNNDLQEQYQKDPQGTMKQHGIAQSDIDLMINNDREGLSKRLGGEYEISSNTITTAAKIKR